MTKTLCCVLLVAMYGCPGPEPAAIKPGNGIKVDASGTISIDDAIVPTGANCSTGEVLQRTASGWACTASAPDAAQLGGKPAAAYLTSGATVSNIGLEHHIVAKRRDNCSATSRVVGCGTVAESKRARIGSKMPR